MTLLERLQNENRIPITFDYQWNDTIKGSEFCIFTSIGDDTETMGGLWCRTEHALGYDKKGNFLHLEKESIEGEEDTDWY